MMIQCKNCSMANWVQNNLLQQKASAKLNSPDKQKEENGKPTKFRGNWKTGEISDVTTQNGKSVWHREIGAPRKQHNFRPKPQDVYVMVNSDQVPFNLRHNVRIFSLFDEIRHIVGYCVSLRVYVKQFGNAPSCRVIRPTQITGEGNVTHSSINNGTNFKFRHSPMPVTAVNADDFHAMINGPQWIKDFSRGSVIQNRFFICPRLRQRCSSTDSSISSISETSIATPFLLRKFQLGDNPHLIPIKLPDGLEAYLRLNLAEHSRADFNGTIEESEFGLYHFREMHRVETMHLVTMGLSMLPKLVWYQNDCVRG